MSEGGKIKKKPININLEAVSPVGIDTPDAPNTGTTLKDVENHLAKLMADVSINDEQRGNMKQFLELKSQVIKSGDLRNDDFERLEELGYGSGGAVLKVKHKPTGVIMARKLITLDIKPSVRTQIMRELIILHKCSSPYIVGFFGSFNHDKEISICMENMDGGSLDLIMKRGGRIPVNVIRNISVAVLTGLHYLREHHSIIHRDVKPSNILVNTLGEIKLCDFGVSGELIDSMANSFVGTRSYMAPERLSGTKYSVLSDIWSFGVSLVEMALGRFPIPKLSDAEIEEEMKLPAAGSVPPRPKKNSAATEADKNVPIFAMLVHVVEDAPPRLPDNYFPPDLRKLVEKCLQKEPTDRENLTKLLEHEFVTKQELNQAAFADWVNRTLEARNT
ncbi:dual specificity mitogen-activated protein kinase kinase 1-like [Dysidea avara]|uniref:dual specificity mitogen-activated protein kinase kinase 1-like n=1 Tax=Dysidea avara TaxID=196820 RepID=UPI003326C6A7